MGKLIRVAVIDDHASYRGGVVSVVNAAPEFEVVAQGASGGDAVRIAQEQQPDIMLLDVNMPENGMDAVREISKGCPAVKTVLLTGLDGIDVDGRRAGARLSIAKGVSARDLVASLHAVYRQV